MSMAALWVSIAVAVGYWLSSPVIFKRWWRRQDPGIQVMHGGCTAAASVIALMMVVIKLFGG